jgi:Bacterial Ig-like domain
MSRLLSIAPIIFTTTLLGSCARQTSPSGGPKDSIPPIKEYTIPNNGTTNYKGKTIEIAFNEFVALNNPKEQIIITPDVQKKFDITARKQKVVITFEHPLADTTTYTINFRNSVQDITEKNNARNLKVAFSTGPYIDSLSITGKIVDPQNYKDVKQASIALYADDTFNIFKHKPIIITETDDKGNYIFENLKPQKYKIYGMIDKNKNLIVDSKTEQYGFQTATINLKSNVKLPDISLQKLDARTLKLISARPYNTYFNIKLSKSLRNYKLISKSTTFSTFAETSDNIKVYNPGIAETDSIKIKLIGTDSVENKIDTTLYAKFPPTKARKEPFTLKTEGFKVYHMKGIITGKIKYSKPILRLNFDSLFYKVDSLTTINFAIENIKIDSQSNTIYIEKAIDKTLLAKAPQQNPASKPTAQKKQPKPSHYTMTAGKGFAISVEQDSSTRIEESIKPTYYDETGIIFVNVETTERAFVVELLDNSFKQIRTVINKKKITFDDLAPGEYQLRLIIDKDSNGEWTPGNFEQGREAEQTFLYKSEKGVALIKLKANFEIGPVLIKY